MITKVDRNLSTFLLSVRSSHPKRKIRACTSSVCAGTTTWSHEGSRKISMDSWTQEIRSSMSQLSALKAVESIKITQTKLRLHFRIYREAASAVVF
jgi:hypothetical protein